MRIAWLFSRWLRRRGHQESLAEVNWQDYDLVYFAGGHGALWDFADNEAIQALTRYRYEADRVVAAVWHGTAALQNVQLSDGHYLIDGKNGTGFGLPR